MLDSDTNRQTVEIRSANNYILLVAFVRPAEVLMDVWGHVSPVPPTGSVRGPCDPLCYCSLQEQVRTTQYEDGIVDVRGQK